MHSKKKNLKKYSLLDVFAEKKIICVSNILRCVYIVMSTNEKQAQ